MDASSRYDSLFQFYASEHGLDWVLLKEQVSAESAFNPKATSPVGAAGLAQFMERTWEDWGAGGSRLNPEESIRAQARYMRWLLDRFKGDVKLALAAYNWGPGNVGKHPDPSAWPAETRYYVEKILSGMG